VAERGESRLVPYILLVALGLIGAIVMSGIMRSFSTIEYKEQNWRVKLSGPAAVCALIVIGGIKFALNTAQTFDVTVRPQSAKSAIITSGSIMIELDSDRRSEFISSKGEADFKQIPSVFRGMKVSILPRVDGYEETPQFVVLSESVVKLPLVELPPPVTIFRGSIALPSGKAHDVRILVVGQEGEATADKFGSFSMRVDGKPGDSVRVKVFVDGKLEYDDFQTLPGPMTIRPTLRR
jgi:hypothetical protein